MTDVLYIHPENHPFPDVVPVGAVAAVNRLPVPVAGRFARELSEADLAAARVVLLDLHWYFPLAALDATLAAIRRANPRARVAVGGLTAAFFSEPLLRRFAVDAVVEGDAEQHLPALVAAWLADDPAPGPLPGVRTRAHPPAPPRRITPAAFDALDWLTIDWFPTYRRLVAARHQAWRERGVGPADSHFPVLPLTRGCARTCAFCAGAYQRRVFGRGLRVRSAAALRRDLLRVAADPALSFVTLYFGEAAVLEALVPGLAGFQVDLDAFLFVCGAVAPAAAEALRAVFRGRVTWSLIPPWELTPAPRAAAAGAPAGAGDPTVAFQALLRHLDGLARTRTVVFQVGAPPPADLPRGESLATRTGRDWAIARPDEARLTAGETLEAQLDRLTAAARDLAAARLLRAIVPALGARVVPDPFDLVALEHAREDATLRPPEQRLRDHLERRVVEDGVYGLAALDLRTVTPGPDGALPASAGWWPAGAKAAAEAPAGSEPAALRWAPTLRGVAWEGPVTLPAGATALAPWPEVPLPDGAPWTPAGWDAARLPTLVLPEAAARAGAAARWGGEAVGEQVTLWWEDAAGRRLEATLAPPPPPEHPRRSEASVFGPVALRPWPEASWPAAIAAAAASTVPARTTGRWRLKTHEATATTLALTFRESGLAGDPLTVWVTPRPPAARLLATARLAWAYRGADRDRFRGGLEAAVAAAMQEAERSL